MQNLLGSKEKNKWHPGSFTHTALCRLYHFATLLTACLAVPAHSFPCGSALLSLWALCCQHQEALSFQFLLGDTSFQLLAVLKPRSVANHLLLLVISIKLALSMLSPSIQLPSCFLSQTCQSPARDSFNDRCDTTRFVQGQCGACIFLTSLHKVTLDLLV